MTKTWVIAYVATFVAAVAMDFVWLSQMADRLYRPVMGDMMLDQFRLPPAIVFYVMYVAGLVFFAVRPALSSRQWSTAFAHGAALGLVAYGTYDLTNQATLKNWSTMLTLADLGWGAILSGSASTLGYFASAARRS